MCALNVDSAINIQPRELYFSMLHTWCVRCAAMFDNSKFKVNVKVKTCRCVSCSRSESQLMLQNTSLVKNVTFKFRFYGVVTAAAEI